MCTITFLNVNQTLNISSIVILKLKFICVKEKIIPFEQSTYCIVFESVFVTEGLHSFTILCLSYVIGLVLANQLLVQTAYNNRGYSINISLTIVM